MKRILFFILPLLVFAADSCKKYEDGPWISLRTKTERLSNTWQVSTAYQNGVDKTSDFNVAYAGYLLTIKKDNSYTLVYNPFNLGTVTDNGTWSFNSDKSHVILVNSNGDRADYTILRLKEKELWVKFTDDNGDVWEVHLVPKA